MNLGIGYELQRVAWQQRRFYRTVVAFGIDLNQMKHARMDAAEQQSAKRDLLALIQDGEAS